MAKPTRQDVISILATAAIVQPPTMVESVVIASGIIFVPPHGLVEDDPIELQIITDTTLGAEDGALPGGLVEAHTYGALPVTDRSLKLKTEPGGSTITSYSTEAVGRFALLGSAWADLDAQIDRSWRYVISQCTAHGGDVESGVVTDMTATHAANRYAVQKAAGNPALIESYEPAIAPWRDDYAPYLAQLFRGVPVKGATDATPTVSEGSPRFRVLGPTAPTATSWGTSSAEVV